MIKRLSTLVLLASDVSTRRDGIRPIDGK